ncbi:MAG: hypothetical protein LBD01_00165 [Puniceicoccales bacterium]|jgi:hypothetical protein|nr:hypothetical protein [Puniceicoccales bacterium]
MSISFRVSLSQGGVRVRYRLALCFAFCISLLLVAAPQCLAGLSNTIATPANAPVEVTVESFHSSLPRHGFAPINITLRNRTSEEQTFQVVYEVGSKWAGRSTTKGTATLRVSPNGRSQTVLYIPVSPGSSSYGSVLELQLYGIGIRDGKLLLTPESGSSTQFFIGMGSELASQYWNAIVARQHGVYSGGGGSRLDGTKIQPSWVPADWRAYVAFSSLWFSSKEWHELDSAARAAIEEWVATGGALNLVCDSKEQIKYFKIAGETREQVNIPRGCWDMSFLGSGKVYYLPSSAFFANKARAEGEKKTTDDFVGRFLAQCSTIKASSAQLFAEPTMGLPLRGVLGTYSYSFALMGLFFFLLVILIGPLNFFVFAPSRRRYLILWTTPLISVGASFLLFLFIIFRDGTHGEGGRIVMAHLVPAQKRLIIKQEQASRTGLLLGRKFLFPEDALIYPFTLSNASMKSDSNTYIKTHDGWAGDWFNARDMQGQYIQTSRPAHGGIRVTLPKAGKPGKIISSLDFIIETLYFVSPDGKSIYEATNIAPGIQGSFKQVDPDPMIARSKMLGAWKAFARYGEVTLQGGLGDVGSGLRDGFFYAKLEKAADLAIPTLDVISWHTDIALIAGPVEFVE